MKWNRNILLWGRTKLWQARGICKFVGYALTRQKNLLAQRDQTKNFVGLARPDKKFRWLGLTFERPIFKKKTHEHVKKIESDR